MQRVLQRMRVVVFEEAADAGSMSSTRSRTCDASDDERPTVVDRFTDEVERVVTERGGVLCRVQLRPPLEVLLQRVGEPSRVQHQKLTDLKRLQAFFEERELYDLIDPSDLSIDNSDRSPADVAAQIRDHFGL